MLLVGLATGSAAAEPHREDKIGDHGRALLAEYQTQTFAAADADDPDVPVDTDFVTLIVATNPGSTDEVAERVESFGGEVNGVEDQLGYLRINVDFADVERVEDIDEVLAIDVDELIEVPEVAPRTTEAAGDVDAEAPGPDTPDDNPYMPANEIGAVDFRDRHPQADGRDVTIGVLDTGVDLDHPALQETTTGDPKIVDWVNATDPNNLVDLVNDDFFVFMSDVSGPTFEAHGHTWTAPDSGDWRFGLFEYPVAGAEEDDWGVLFRPEDGTILVDLHQNRDFSDEEPIEEFSESRDVRHFGEDDPDTEISEAHAFVATGLDAHGGMVHIGLDHHGHGTHVAGIAAGHGLFGGQMNGAAPGAEVVSMRACYSTQCSTAALTDGMVQLATSHGVDVINMSIGGLQALNDGQDARDLLYNRLVEETGVQMFISAGNDGAGMNTVGLPSVADRVMAVGASVSAETWAANYGAEAVRDHGLFPFSSRGPREDGGFKPDITAPGSAISATPVHTEGAPVPEAGYELPPGYAMYNGTSMAAPQAAGGAALLLSKADQEGRYVSPAELRAAIAGSAEFHDSLTALEQGNGQFDVPEAWNLLRHDSPVDDVTVTGPVCTEQSGQLVTPGSGPGLYNRCLVDDGGHAPGETQTYDLEVSTAASGTQRYRVSVLGDEDVFQLPRTLRVDDGAAAELEVTATAEQGVHSAVLQLDNPRTRGVDHTALLTIVAGAEVADSWSVSEEVDRAGVDNHPVAVPPGTQEVTVRMSGVADTSVLRWVAFSPLGPTAEEVPPGDCYTGRPNVECDPLVRTYTDPQPGVWDLAVDASRLSGPDQSPYELEVTLTGGE
ncbi:S8 family serine peptidase [Lipingzhangella sp. LS1_29]|uniref:S8 family serine peptidase n=1 Tax=Lipingzhangella rawalii TaxID=2055835 RepID=A0ABU2H0S0_9ACTN|nr:S8 family serine peptidase [Lipingzhangella rawalii]